LSLHLISTASANWGPLVYNKSLHFFRYFYQQPIVEGILLSSLVVHTAAGIFRIVSRWFTKDEPNSNSSRISVGLFLHRASALYLILSIIGHVAGTRLLALYTNTPSTFSDISFTLDTWPLFYPYYILLSTSGLYHMSYGILQVFKKVKISRTWWWTCSLVSLGSILISGVFVFGNHPLRNLNGRYEEIHKEFELLGFFPSN